jgi:DNA ligase-1
LPVSPVNLFGVRLSTLSETFEQVAATSSRLRRVELVAALLRRASSDERAAVVYLLQAQLRPPYEGVEVGLGERLLIRAVAAAYDVPPARVARRLASLGDLGRVAEALAPAQSGSSLTVRRAYDGLLAVAEAGGAGSVERKIRSMVALLHRASGPEAKLLVRVAQGRLRLGLGDQTILEAAALAALGGRGERSVLEHAYNVRSDLGTVVALAFTKRARGLAGLGPAVGVPVRPALAQRLPSADAIVARLGEVQVEPKYDGFRVQVHRNGNHVSIFSRRLEDVTDMFPEMAHAVRRTVRARQAIIEGEALAYDPDTGEVLPFQVTMTRKRTANENVTKMSEEYPTRLYAFDVLLAGRRNCLPDAQRDRTRRLRTLLRSREDGAVVATEAIVTGDAAELSRYFDTMVGQGLEGVLAKRLDAPYRAGARGYDWVKLKRAYQSKLRDTVDVVLVGYLRGRGKRSTLGIGSLVGAVYDPKHDVFRTVAKIGSGLSDAGWKAMRTRLDADATARRPARVDSLLVPDVWVEPRYVVEVLADEITRSPVHTCGKHGDEPGYALRFPRMVSELRADKSVEDATTEREIVDMYQQQRAPRRMQRVR